MNMVENFDQIVHDSFGLWIASLFSAIGARNPTLSFEERKAAFFCSIERLLREGRVKFVAPGADCYTSSENPHPRFTIEDEEAHWHESPEAIVEQLRALWPEQAGDDDDQELAIYFYSIPGIIWVADDGTLVAS